MTIALFDHRYELLRVLGEGAVGQVLLARDIERDAHVALKLFRPSAPGQASRAAREYQREVDAMSALDHPNIIRILDVGEARYDGTERFYYTMEYVSGVTLDRLHGERPVSPRWAIETVITLARAAAAAHAGGFVHRDIKPRNVLVVGGSRPMLIDFGLVKLLVTEDGTRRSTARVKGTWAYMAPEQFHDQRADQRSDVYSLGGVLLWLLTGVPANPVRGRGVGPEEIEAAFRAAPPGGDALPHLDTALSDIWSRALAYEPSARFASMAEFGDALAAYLEAHDRGGSHRLVASAGVPPRTVFLDRPALVVGRCDESPLTLPEQTPELLFRLIRPRDQFVLLAGPEVSLACGHLPWERRPLQHGDAIDWGALRFVYRREPEPAGSPVVNSSRSAST